MDNIIGLYIHIPFCVKKCSYCAFLSFAAEPEMRERYVQALVNEIRLRGEAASDHTGNEEGITGRKAAIDTVYVGGGTPSILDVSQIREIMHAVKFSFEIKADAEVTIEANPGTLGVSDDEIRGRLQAYRDIGFNRLSMGVQSMDNDRLRFLGRVHNAEDVARDVRLARETGFDNINLDLIFSVPGESTDDAIKDARRIIIEFEPEHISCYSLQIEEGTPLAEQIELGMLKEVPDEEDRETYHKLISMLRNSGYEHYEISNFAKMPSGVKAQGFACDDVSDKAEVETLYRAHHNSNYWNMSDYIGAGLGASGFANGLRYKNTSDIDRYIKTYSDAHIRCNSGNGFSFPYEEEHLNTTFDNISEAIFTGLRRREGIYYEDAVVVYRKGKGAEQIKEAARCDLFDVADKGSLNKEEINKQSAKELFWSVFSETQKEAEAFADEGLLIINDDGIRLTEQGIDISNSILALFV